MSDDYERFKETVWEYYRTAGRHDLPWRRPAADGSFDPYQIMVSEMMLQQTQVARVTEKYREFLERFPTISSLAAAELGDVLRAWNGLGYNRRAKFLHQAAQQIARDGFPQTLSALTKLPGIGPNTAGAILAYAFNQPAVFVETNIRTVFIHHFFSDVGEVADKKILGRVAETLDTERPREWYWALMDYGAYLKREVGNLNVLSKSYARQAAFEGSRRQIRGQVLKLLGAQPHSRVRLRAAIADQRLEEVIKDLLEEGLITQKGVLLSL